MKHGLELISCGSIFLIDGHNVFLFFYYIMFRALQYCCVESFVSSYNLTVFTLICLKVIISFASIKFQTNESTFH